MDDDAKCQIDGYSGIGGEIRSRMNRSVEGESNALKRELRMRQARAGIPAASGCIAGRWTGTSLRCSEAVIGVCAGRLVDAVISIPSALGRVAGHVTVTVLEQKAARGDIATRPRIERNQANNGWVESRKIRHNVVGVENNRVIPSRNFGHLVAIRTFIVDVARAHVADVGCLGADAVQTRIRLAEIGVKRIARAGLA